MPASEIDTNPTGFAVAVGLSVPSTQLKIYKITRNATTGNPVITATPTSVTVPSYTVPPSIPQKGTSFRIDSSDTRNTQAQAALDPAHGGQVRALDAAHRQVGRERFLPVRGPVVRAEPRGA